MPLFSSLPHPHSDLEAVGKHNFAQGVDDDNLRDSNLGEDEKKPFCA